MSRDRSGGAWPVPFSEVRPGLHIPEWEVALQSHTGARLDAATGAEHAPGSSAPVNPALAGNLAIGLAFRVIPRNVLHTRQTIVLRGEANAGDTLLAAGHVADTSTRRDRAYVTIAGTIRNGDDTIWEVEAEFTVPEAPIEDLPRSVEGVPLQAPAELEPAGTIDRLLTLDDMAAFAGRGNFHSDRAVAARYGYEAPVAQGLQVAAIGFPLLAGITTDWPRTGRLDIRFVGQTLEGETVTMTAGRDRSGAVWLTGRNVDRGHDVVLSRYEPRVTEPGRRAVWVGS